MDEYDKVPTIQEIQKEINIFEKLKKIMLLILDYSDKNFQYFCLFNKDIDYILPTFTFEYTADLLKMEQNNLIFDDLEEDDFLNEEYFKYKDLESSLYRMVLCLTELIVKKKKKKKLRFFFFYFPFFLILE